MSRTWKIVLITLAASIATDLVSNASHVRYLSNLSQSVRTGIDSLAITSLWQDFKAGSEQEMSQEFRDNRTPHTNRYTGAIWFVSGVDYASKQAWNGNWFSKLMIVCFWLLIAVIAVTILFNKSEGKLHALLTMLPIFGVIALLVLTCLAWLISKIALLVLSLFDGTLQITSVVAGLGLPVLVVALMNSAQNVALDQLPRSGNATD